MTAALRKARVLLSVYYAHLLEWRSEIVLWMLSSTLPFIMMAVWGKASESGALPYTPGQFAQYYIALFIIRQFTIVWVIYEFEHDVVTGRLSPYLLQPIDPAWRHFAKHTAERLTRLPFLAALLLLVFLVYPPARWTPNVLDIAKTIPVIFLAFALRFVMQYTFALLAFWTERASAIEQLWFLVYLFFSGMIGPMDVYPETLRQIAAYTPFPYLLYYPVYLLLGWQTDASQTVFGQPIGFVTTVAMLAFWLGVFLVINRWLWRVALRRYSAMGA